jgi:twitching motility protein PilT
MRQNPDVILVGEMRDLETIQLAITAAETGHLVFSTLHTVDAAQTIDRVVDVFEPDQQEQIRTQLSVTLQAVISQQLLPTKDGKGRIAAFEVLVATPAIRTLIREGKTHQLYLDIQTGGQYGMQTLDSHLLALLRDGMIDYEHALAKCSNVSEFQRRAASQGLAEVASAAN